ncbi:MAG: 50S ribosomal protein L4 [Verrucomicrobiales bacterium]|nr:50S ribosomal protein L4 [Verrucomicrobiales bacterium]
MAAKNISIADAKSANINLIEDAEVGGQAVHDVVVAMHANRRTGSANSKTRGEVSATGKKPFRQKGTGRARQGGNASPIHRGGGVVFGPRPRDYSKKVPRSVRRLAFSKALTERINDGAVFGASAFSVSDGKTQSFVKEVSNLVGDARKVIIVGKDFDEMTKRAGRNVKPVLLMSAHEVNTEHLLYHDKIVILDEAMEVLAQRTVR